MDPYRLIIEREIRDRRATEQWYRANAWAVWTDLRAENRAILRALLRIRREAKRGEQPDPVTLAKALPGSDWTDPKG